MNADVYQNLALNFSVDHLTSAHRLLNAAVGLAGETGEVAALIHSKVHGDHLTARYLTLVMTVGHLGEMIKKSRWHGHDLDYGQADATAQAIKRLAEQVINALGFEALHNAPTQDEVSIDPIVKDQASKEVGDVQWYAAQAADALNVPLSVVMSKNIEKLSRRYGRAFSVAASLNRSEA